MKLPVILSNMHRKFEEAAVDQLICRQRIICEAAVIGETKQSGTFGQAVSRFFG